MPDLFTHLVAARVPGAFVRDRRLQALLVIGTFLPDIVGKGLYWVLRNTDSSLQASHCLAGLLLVSYVACLFVDESLRRPAFFLLAAGGAIHVLVDLANDNMGVGSVVLFLPFSNRGTEFGWIDPENVILLIPIDAAILATTWALERRFRRVQQ